MTNSYSIDSKVRLFALFQPA